MKGIILIWANLVLAVARLHAGEAKTNDWGPVTNQVQMSIGLSEGVDTFGTNEPVTLTVAFRNLSTNTTFALFKPGYIERSGAPSFTIIFPSGKEVTPKPGDAGHFHGGFIVIRPGRISDFRFDLGSLCRFDQAGTYKVISRWSLERWGGGGAIEVVSNPLNFRLDPALRKERKPSTNENSNGLRFP